MSELRSVGNVFTFDMTQVTKQIIKEFPMPESPILYTVFINQKQHDKLNVSPEEFLKLHLCVQGEPTLDIPISDCPGEIGILCTNVQIMMGKNQAEQSIAEKEILSAAQEVATTETPAIILLDINEIIISKNFQKSPPNPAKVAEKRQMIEKSGEIEKPILLSKKNVLLDGYAWYMAAIHIGMHKVPVKYN